MLEIKHPQLVARLVKDGQAIIDSLTPDKAHAAHMVCGVSGEVGELLDAILKATMEGQVLDHENVVEELGDLEFYLEATRVILGVQREVACWPPTPENLADPLTYHAAKIAIHGSEMLDATKKQVVYVTPLDREVALAAMGQVEKHMDALRALLNITRQQCLDANIAKLRKRYEGFIYSDQQAQERADKNVA
jgi:NTP pyrophosphatase (non-canonical NTP hydrolase)